MRNTEKKVHCKTEGNTATVDAMEVRCWVESVAEWNWRNNLTKLKTIWYNLFRIWNHPRVQHSTINGTTVHLFFFCCLNSHLFILLFHIVMLWNTIQSHFKTIPVKYRSFNTDIDSTVLLWQCWLWTIRLVWSFLDRCQTRINQENILFFSSSLKQIPKWLKAWTEKHDLFLCWPRCTMPAS